MTRVQVYLPQGMDRYADAHTHACEELAERFGGFTEYANARGGWVHDGEIITESVTVVESYGDISPANAVIFMDVMVEYIHEINGYDESAMMYTVNNKQYLVE